MVDGAFGEILTTCEKIRWVVEKGEQALQPEYRDVGPLTMHKTARVEYQPLGVLAALVSWNYPFHNLYGQIISAIFAGNAIVVKVSEYGNKNIFPVESAREIVAKIWNNWFPNPPINLQERIVIIIELYKQFYNIFLRELRSLIIPPFKNNRKLF